MKPSLRIVKGVAAAGLLAGREANVPMEALHFPRDAVA